jgi:hypothetical protein
MGEWMGSKAGVVKYTKIIMKQMYPICLHYKSPFLKKSEKGNTIILL